MKTKKANINLILKTNSQKGELNKFKLIDFILLLFVLLISISYNYEVNLAPTYLLAVIQLLLVWFILRICFSLFPSLMKYAVSFILFLGVIEAVWGLGQLYGYFYPRHHLFKTTGSFFNPGPYGGFLALMFPLTLHYWLIYRKRNKVFEYIFLGIGVILILVFPATLSRTAWIAAIAGCGLVLFFDTLIISKLQNYLKHHKKHFFVWILIISLFIIGAIYGIFSLKKDSATGRLFIWKITTLAIKDAPIKGVGLGGFPAAYAKAQVKYFKSGEASQTEKLVAGSPEYAFNEYLKIFLEQGLVGGILFLIITAFIIRGGIKNGQIGATGSFLALSIFAFASYPFYLWEFLLMWVLLGTICVSKTNKSSLSLIAKSNTKRKRYIPAFLLLSVLIIGSLICAKHQYTYYQANKAWKKLHTLYALKAYESIADAYQPLYAKLNHNPKFVFEYAVALNAAKQRKRADTILSRGLQISCDPMFYNVKGRNHHEMGEYNKAETAYINSTFLLPERIYPYYLLTKLYADSANYQPQKMHKAAKAVLENEPKVHSMAINEMRNEVKKIIKEKEKFIYEK